MKTANELALVLSGRIRRRPYESLLIAAGLGYVLGGGLFTRFTLNMVRVGVRMGALPLIKRELLVVADSVLSSQSRSPS